MMRRFHGRFERARDVHIPEKQRRKKKFNEFSNLSSSHSSASQARGRRSHLHRIREEITKHIKNITSFPANSNIARSDVDNDMMMASRRSWMKFNPRISVENFCMTSCSNYTLRRRSNTAERNQRIIVDER